MNNMNKTERTVNSMNYKEACKNMGGRYGLSLVQAKDDALAERQMAGETYWKWVYNRSVFLADWSQVMA